MFNTKSYKLVAVIRGDGQAWHSMFVNGYSYPVSLTPCSSAYYQVEGIAVLNKERSPYAQEHSLCRGKDPAIGQLIGLDIVGL